MFLDVHAHSNETSMFLYSPKPPDQDLREEVAVRHFSIMLDEISDCFQFKKCDYNNDKAKRNCARLGINRDFSITNSFTLECSVWGYENKKPKKKSRMKKENDDDSESDNKEEKKEEKAEVFQFTSDKIIEFGKHLSQVVGKHLSLAFLEEDVPEEEKYGLNIGLHDFVHTQPPEMKSRILPISSMDYMLKLKDYEKEKQPDLPRQTSFKALNSLKYIMDEA